MADGVAQLVPHAQRVQLERLAVAGGMESPGTRVIAAAEGASEVAAAAEAGGGGEDVLAALRGEAEGLGSAQLCALLRIPAGELRELMAPLLASGAVVGDGRTRGTR